MKCPIDNTNLQMSERQGIEIDYCPSCRGVWLDRGELDKIIERTNREFASPVTEDIRYQHKEYGSESGKHYPRKKRKRESFFDDLFDF